MSTFECYKCGSVCHLTSNFCSYCGAKFQENELIKIPINEARVIYASRKIDELPEDFFVTPVNSELAKNAGKPFDSSSVPQLIDLVPADCIWACFKHPGYLRPPRLGQSLIDKYKQISTYTGRTLQEMSEYFGEPEVEMFDSQIKTIVWSEVSPNGIFQVQFFFDRYDVCIDVGEINQV